MMVHCVCGSGKYYKKCCELFISGNEKPKTPEQLMRSRYTAYTQANIDYIQQTMRSPASDDFDAASAKAWAKQVKWKSLKVQRSFLKEEAKGFVEFIAYFEINQKKHTIHELSEFHLIEGVWFYMDGVML